MNSTIRFAVCALCAVLCVIITFPTFAQGRVKTDVGKSGDKHTIYAVLRHGETEVEVGFRDYLTRRGLSFRMTVHKLDTGFRTASDFIEEINRNPPDLIYTLGTGATTTILGAYNNDTPKDYVQNIPGLFALVAYPQEANIISSFENPGRPVTGVDFLAPVEAQLNTILAYRKFKTMAVIYDESATDPRINVEKLRQAVPDFGIKLIELPIPTSADGQPDAASFPYLVAQAKDQGAEILYMGADPFLVRHADMYTDAAIAAGLPTFTATQLPLTNSRALFGLVTDYYALGKQTAIQAEAILTKKKRAEAIPVSRLARYKLWINMDVAREVDLYPPMDMISIADFKTSHSDN